jgi:nucleoside diphosphate kinase
VSGGGLARWLSADRRKRALYADDIYFREGWADAGAVLGEGRRALLERATLVLFKPEAIAGRRVAAAEPFLAARGFAPLAARPVRLDRHTVRALWRYQLNAAPLSVVWTIDAVVSAAEALVVLVRDRTGGAPAAPRLAACKGASRLAGPQPGTLRAALGCSTLLVNFVHVPDEPADVVRELAVLFPGDARRELLGALAQPGAGGGWAAVHAQLEPLYARTPAHPIDPAPAWARLRELAGTGEPRAAMARAALAAADELPDDATLQRIVAWLATADLGLDAWDRLLVGAQLVVAQPPERRPLIGRLTLEEADVELPAPAAEGA